MSKDLEWMNGDALAEWVSREMEMEMEMQTVAQGMSVGMTIPVLTGQMPCRNQRMAFGYNHSVSHGGRTYHVQTEDSGRERGHVYTHLFHCGAILASSKLEYSRTVIDTEVMTLLKRSHKTMLRQLVRGVYDDLIGRRIGRSSAAALEADLAPADAEGSPLTVDVATSNERTRRESLDMQNVKEVLDSLMGNVAGALGAALVDYESGMCMGSAGNGIDVEVAAAGNTEVMKAKMRVMKDLGIPGGIEDVLITLESQYHIIRPVKEAFFMYLAFDRKQGNLAMARHQMSTATDGLKI